MRYFYIDTENISPTAWGDCLDKFLKTDAVLLFYTYHSPKVPMEYMPKIQACWAEIDSIAVQSGTKNALDFVLISRMSQNALLHAEDLHIIVSSDSGYDVVIEDLTDQGFNAKRISGDLSDAFLTESGHEETKVIKVNKRRSIS